MSWQQQYVEKYYKYNPGWIDGTTAFHALCKEVISPQAKILEIGAGPSNRTSRYLKTIGELHGVDISSEVRDNDALESASVIKNDKYPFSDNVIDVCVSDFVIEHVSDPRRHLKEINRVLRPGGLYVFRTPNQWHYVTIASKITPHKIHLLIANRMRNLPPESHAPYPTIYAMNSKERISSYAKETGFIVEYLRMVEPEPSYGMSSRLLFFAFMIYERLVNSTDFLSGLRCNIFAVLKKVI